jgi:hypothetical protein
MILSTPLEGRTGRRTASSGDAEMNEGNEMEAGMRSHGRYFGGQRRATFTEEHGIDEL